MLVRMIQASDLKRQALDSQIVIGETCVEFIIIHETLVALNVPIEFATLKSISSCLR